MLEINRVGNTIQTSIGLDDTVLDLGCGIMQASYDLRCKSILGVDIHKPYIQKISELWPTVQLGLDELDRFVDKSYDVVIALDILEHLDKSMIRIVLENMKRICRKKVIIFTPSIFKDNKEAVKDSWGMGECNYQEHKCLVPKELLSELGYEVIDKGESRWGIYDKCNNTSL